MEGVKGPGGSHGRADLLYSVAARNDLGPVQELRGRCST